LGGILTGVVEGVVVVGEKAVEEGCFEVEDTMVIGFVGVAGVDVGAGADVAVGVDVAEAEAAAKRSNLFLLISSADIDDSGVVESAVGEVTDVVSGS